MVSCYGSWTIHLLLVIPLSSCLSVRYQRTPLFAVCGVWPRGVLPSLLDSRAHALLPYDSCPAQVDYFNQKGESGIKVQYSGPDTFYKVCCEASLCLSSFFLVTCVLDKLVSAAPAACTCTMRQVSHTSVFWLHTLNVSRLRLHTLYLETFNDRPDEGHVVLFFLKEALLFSLRSYGNRIRFCADSTLKKTRVEWTTRKCRAGVFRVARYA